MVINTLPELQKLCPGSWDELSCSVFQKIFSDWELEKEAFERDYVKLLCILSGQPFRLQDPTPEKEEAIYQVTKWVLDPITYSKEIPKSITIPIEGVGNTEIQIPDGVGMMSIGQNILVKQLLDKSRFIEESLSMATAIYLQPLISGDKFDYEKARGLEILIAQMPAKTVYPIGFFLLHRAWVNGRKPVSFLNRIRIILGLILVRMLPGWLKWEDYRPLPIYR